MPIRINLLAEQQAAEEARRKDPLKRAIIIGSAFVLLFLVWTLKVHMDLKGRVAELATLDTEFKKADDKAKLVRNIVAETGDLERRSVSLDRYSSNRVLWATMLDALQKSTTEQIRFKSVSTRQQYSLLLTNTFFSTNVMVKFTPTPPSWKFWASKPGAVPVIALASNRFAAFTNSLPFSTNVLPYKVKADVVGTNMQTSEVSVRCDFTLPFATSEDIDLTISAGDYGNPPGGSIDSFAKNLIGLPYFTQRLSGGDDRLRFVERPPNPEPDLNLPGSPQFVRFTVRLKYKDRVLVNE